MWSPILHPCHLPQCLSPPISTHPFIVRCHLSTTPFCCHVYGAVVWCTTPNSSKNPSNCPVVNSPPLSVRNLKSNWPDSLSARGIHTLMHSAASLFCFKLNTQCLRVKSSMRDNTNLAPIPFVGVRRGPWRSSWTMPWFQRKEKKT